MTIILKWLRVSLEIIVSVVVMATGTALWLLMAVPDPISILIGFVGFAMYFMAMADMETCEKLAREKKEQSIRIIKNRQNVLNVQSLAAEKRL
jgi:NAD/NADP transhydrogenase beta subunit